MKNHTCVIKTQIMRIVFRFSDLWNSKCYRHTTSERIKIVRLVFNYLAHNKIFADYAEFGVWRGDTFATVYHIVNNLSNIFRQFKNIRFYAFDSFKGFPKLTDIDCGNQFQEGARLCSREDFMRNLVSRGVPLDKIIVFEGWFKDTLNNSSPVVKEIEGRSIGFAYIDCDLYESAKDVLEFLRTKMLPGGVIVFDNWFCFAGNPQKGEQLAYAEFLMKYPEIVLVPFHKFGWHGNSFIFHLKEKDISCSIKL